jgi:hypothetical protein
LLVRFENRVEFVKNLEPQSAFTTQAPIQSKNTFTLRDHAQFRILWESLQLADQVQDVGLTIRWLPPSRLTPYVRGQRLKAERTF